MNESQNNGNKKVKGILLNDISVVLKEEAKSLDYREVIDGLIKRGLIPGDEKTKHQKLSTVFQSLRWHSHPPIFENINQTYWFRQQFLKEITQKSFTKDNFEEILKTYGYETGQITQLYIISKILWEQKKPLGMTDIWKVGKELNESEISKIFTGKTPWNTIGKYLSLCSHTPRFKKTEEGKYVLNMEYDENEDQDEQEDESEEETEEEDLEPEIIESAENPQEYSGYWFVQSNSEYYDLISAANEQKIDYWTNKKKKAMSYFKDIKEGDKIFFWQSGDNRGIIGKGIVNKKLEPFHVPEIYKKYFKKQEDFIADVSQAIECTYLDIFLENISEKLRLSELKKDPEFSSQFFGKILTIPRGTFFPIPGKGLDFINKHVQEIIKPEKRIACSLDIKLDESLNTIYKDTKLYPSAREGEFIRDLIDALLLKGQIILMGPPGTSKTYLAEQIALRVTGGKSTLIEKVQFHPSYSYEDFVECNEVHSGLSVTPRKKIFREFCEQASQESNKDDKFVFIIDEINRGNVEGIFGELIYGLDKRNKRIRSVYCPEPLMIPDNLFIIGTMNTVDLSIANIDAALRRRFYIIELMPDENVLKNWLTIRLEDQYPEFQQVLIALLKELNKKIQDHKLMGIYRTMGHAMLMLRECYKGNNFLRIWKNLEMEWNFTIKPTILEYLNFNTSEMVEFENLFENIKKDSKIKILIENALAQQEEEINQIEDINNEDEVDGEISPKNLSTYIDFYNHLKERMTIQASILNPSKFRRNPQNRQYFFIQASGLEFGYVLLQSKKTIKVEFVLYKTRDFDYNAIYQQLLRSREEIEKKIGKQLEWNLKDVQSYKRIRMNASDFDLFNKSKWDGTIDIVIVEMNKFVEVFHQYIMKIIPKFDFSQFEKR